MKAARWYGKGDIRVEKVPDPIIEEQTDIIIKVTSSAICGSDLHLYNGLMSGMEKGDVLGHESMGEVVEIGSDVKKLKVGDRVVVPFNISCGHCYFCDQELFSLCDNSNPAADQAKEVMGHSPAGLFGYSHLLGGFSGGQAEYLRVPYADVGPLKVPEGLEDERVLFLSDIYPTGYMAAENCDIKPGDTVAIWGCGPVAQFAIQSAWMLGAGRVIAIDRVPERLQMAEKFGKAEIINFDKDDVYEVLMEWTDGRGPDSCIDAVGAEAHHASSTIVNAIDSVRESLHIPRNRPFVLNEAIRCCRKGGTFSVPGVYTSSVDHLLFGAAMNKALTIKTGQTHVQRYLEPLLKRITAGEIDPTFVITDRIALEDVPDAYHRFNAKENGCIKVVIKP